MRLLHRLCIEMLKCTNTPLWEQGEDMLVCGGVLRSRALFPWEPEFKVRHQGGWRRGGSGAPEQAVT